MPLLLANEFVLHKLVQTKLSNGRIITGGTTTETRFRKAMKKQSKLIQGNAAIAQGAFYAGARFYAGYPITPSSEIAEIASRELPKLGGIFMQMEDELASMGAIVGASLAGVKSFTATSGPGFSLMQENLGMATMGEVPVVVVVLARMGVVSIEKLREFRGYFIVVAFIIAAVITPPDVVSQLALAIPMCLLYELGIVSAQLFIKHTQAPESKDD